MEKEVKRWLNELTYFPLGNIIVKIVQKNDVYYSIVDFVKNACERLNIEILIIKLDDLPSDYTRSLPNKTLGFKTIEESIKTIDEESIKYFSKKNAIKDVEFLILVNPNSLPRIEIRHILQFLSIYPNQIFLLSGLFVFIFSFLIGRELILGVFIIIHLITFYFLYELSSFTQNKSTLTRKVCNFSVKNEEKADRCSTLKLKTNKLFGIFEFSDAGLYYFTLLVFLDISTTLQNNLEFHAISYLILIILGLMFSIYSLYTQTLVKTYCNICLFTIAMVILQATFLPTLFEYNFNYIALIYLCFVSIITLVILLISYNLIVYNERLFVVSEKYKKILLRNKESIISNMKNFPIEKEELSKISFNHNPKENRQNLTIITDLQCFSCQHLYEEIKNYKLDNDYNLRIVFHILEKGWKIENNELYKLNIKLAMIFEKYGFESYLNVIDHWKSSGKATNSTHKYISTNFSLENKDSNYYELIIQSQNDILSDRNLTIYPIIVYKGKFIPNYINLIDLKKLMDG